MLIELSYIKYEKRTARKKTNTNAIQDKEWITYEIYQEGFRFNWLGTYTDGL